jgi:hypothetical protein|tara:strand:+ start:2824 stop:3360 length:537 start_codon:yes stop_codon:yes gene_type:complete
MVEIIPKSPRKYSLSINALFYASIVAFILSVGGFWALLFLESRNQQELERLEIALGAEKTPEQAQLENSVFQLRAKLRDFAMLTQEQKNLLAPFEFLEATVHPSVVFSTFNTNAKEHSVQIKGQAASFVALEEQIAILEAREELTSLTLSDIRILSEGGIGFQLELQFPEDFFTSISS